VSDQARAVAAPMQWDCEAVTAASGGAAHGVRVCGQRRSPSGSFRIKLLYKAGAVAGVMLLALTLWIGLPTSFRGAGITDRDGNRRGTDFLTHYTAGRMVLAGDARDLYDAPVQAAAQKAAINAPLDRPSPFLLPPAAALLFAPLALLPYSVAATLWAVVAIGLIAISLRLVWPLSPLRGRVPAALATLALVGTYPVSMNLVGGNNAALWLTIYALGARYLLTGRAIAAGLVLGFGALKPQLFLAVPVLLLIQRRWRTLGAFAAVAGLLGAISLALIGPAGAREYVEVLTSDTYRSEVAIPDAWRMLSLPAFARGVVPGVNDLVTVTIVIGGLVLLGWAVRRAPLPVAYAAAVLVSVAIDPHCFLYDGMVLAVPILLRAGGLGWGAPSWALAALWGLTWAVPFRTPPESGSFGAVPWAVLPVLVLMVAALRDAKIQGDCPPPIATCVAAASEESALLL
jgi:alpha-1,2-mannosyltransferase